MNSSGLDNSSPLPLSARSLSEQCRGTRPSRNQTPSKSHAGIPVVSLGVANHSGIETVNMIRKGQTRWLAKEDIAGQVAFISSLFSLALAA